MKIRTDFVTNSSSSSYVRVNLDTSNGARRLGDFEYVGFYTFRFKDPTKKLEKAKSVKDVADAIVFSSGDEHCFPTRVLENCLADIDDFSSIKRVEIVCHEEEADRDEFSSEPKDTHYSYDFASGEASSWSESYGYD